jgi:hypothetical protein
MPAPQLGFTSISITPPRIPIVAVGVRNVTALSPLLSAPPTKRNTPRVRLAASLPVPAFGSKTNWSMTMFEFGPTVKVEASTNRIWVCPAALVAIRSLNSTSWPSTMRCGAAPGGVPTASGFTALSTPTRSAKAGELAPRQPKRRAADSRGRNRRRRMAVIAHSLKADLRAD